MTIWEVRNISTSKGLSSERKVVDTFDNIFDAAAMAKTDKDYKVRAKPPVRRKKDNME